MNNPTAEVAEFLHDARKSVNQLESWTRLIEEELPSAKLEHFKETHGGLSPLQHLKEHLRPLQEAYDFAKASGQLRAEGGLLPEQHTLADYRIAIENSRRSVLKDVSRFLDLSGDLTSGTKAAEYVTHLQKAADSLGSIDIAHKPEFRDVDVDAEARSLVNSGQLSPKELLAHEELPGREHVRVLLKIPKPVGTVRLDQTFFRRALPNLVGNALRHGTGNLVELELRRRGDMLFANVTNEGPQISADRLRRVGRVRTGEPDILGKNLIRGYGALIASEIAKMHGGSFKLRNYNRREKGLLLHYGQRATLTARIRR